MIEIILETLHIVPLLFAVYFLVELFEHKFGHSLKDKLQKVGKFGPIIGGLFGALPQCGFSVIGASLFLSGYLSLGTLISIFLATSDEALPILLSDPSKASFVLPIITYKIIYAAIVGIIIDLIIPSFKQKKQVTQHNIACCGHHHSKNILIHPLIHTIKLFLFLVFFSITLHYLFDYIKPVNLLNPFSSALIGLIPNCAASVFITQLFMENAISFSVLMAGLFSSAGLGLLVLFKEGKNLAQSFKIISLLYIFSVLGGFMIQSIL